MTVIPFKQKHKTFHAEMVLFEGRKRRQWAVVERGPDGTETAWPVYRGKKSEAIWMAGVYRENEARERETQARLDREPLWQMISAMDAETRVTLTRLLNIYELREDSANA